MTTFDDLPVEVRRAQWGWFGPPWPSGVCYDDDDNLRADMRKDFPTGESCPYCEEEFSEATGDSGQAMPFVSDGGRAGIGHVHKECVFLEVAGPLAHHEKRCYHYGGEGNGTPGMTYRAEALEVWRRFTGG